MLLNCGNCGNRRKLWKILFMACRITDCRLLGGTPKKLRHSKNILRELNALMSFMKNLLVNDFMGFWPIRGGFMAQF